MSYSKNVYDEQENRIKKYQKRMRDLVEAYKNLQGEKETLEITLKTLNNSKEGVSKHKIEPESDDDEVENFSNQIATLSNSISVLTDEKRKMERNFQEDKRITRESYENQMVKLRETVFDLNEENEKQKKKLSELQALLNESKEFCRGLENEMMEMRSKNESRISVMEENITNLSSTIGRFQKENNEMKEHIREMMDNNDDDNCTIVKKMSIIRHTPDILQCSESEMDIPTIISDINHLVSRVNEIDPFYNWFDNQLTLWTDVYSKELEIDEGNEDKNRGVTGYEVDIKLDDKKNWKEVEKQLELSMNKVSILERELCDNKVTNEENLKNLRDNIIKLEWTHQRQYKRMIQEHETNINELQTELTSHRNRTLNILSEKDEQIKLYKSQLATSLSSSSLVGGAPHYPAFKHPTKSSSSPSNSPIVTFDQTSCPLYQCCETKSRLDQELRKLRAEKRRLESAVHKLESDIEYEASQHQLQRNADTLSNRNTLNEQMLNATDSTFPVTLEYLRNLFRHLLQSRDSLSKTFVIKAITQVLQFPPDEVALLEYK